MVLEIRDDQELRQIQGHFHHSYPFLKIAFFEKEATAATKEKSLKHIRNHSRLLGEFRVSNNTLQKIEVRKDMKVREIEQVICNTYRLHAQIFRRSGNVWLETTVTSNWSLEEQNRQGEIITNQMQQK